jgi:hypothetical protein
MPIHSAPFINGPFDVDSPNGPITPWLRSIDGFHTHDDAFRLAIAGGVTSVQVLPGSGNAIGKVKRDYFRNYSQLSRF